MKRQQTVRVALSALLLVAAGFQPRGALALENIIRPYQSVRSAGMGGVKLTTGLYDENIYGNPARITADPIWRVQLPIDLSVESTLATLGNVSTIVGGGDDFLKRIATTAGKNNHLRAQYAFPGVYFPNVRGSKMSFAVVFLTSIQTDIALRKAYQLEPVAIVDTGPAITVARKFLKEDELSVGLTTRVAYRGATRSNFTLADVIKGSGLGISELGRDGTHVDFDLGGTYRLPIKWKEFEFTTGAVLSNILGGSYSNLGVSLLGTTGRTTAQSRAFGFGASATRASLWKFTNAKFALDFQDIGNHGSGSLFRLIHLGGEAQISRFLIRLGINQGYFTFGLGLDVKAVTFDLATYGEEMSTNAGGQEDRRFAARLGFHI